MFFTAMGLVGHVGACDFTSTHSLDMNAQYFIDKFTAIPDDKWTTGQLLNSQGQSCALGHCGERRGVYEATLESAVLKALFARHYMRPDDVNDYSTGMFKQATPKARILAALEYIKSL